MSTFDIYPAIDLRDGRVVRLSQGDFARETSYSSDPERIALNFADQGARWIHVVDLDGARAGAPIQLGAMARIVEVLGGRAQVQMAGGLRTPESVATAFSAGAARAVVGTAALRDSALVTALVASHGADRIVVALDVREGQAVGEAWQAGTDAHAVELAFEALSHAGASLFAVTAIERDGLLEGPDLDLLARLRKTGTGAVIASGGIATLADLEAVRRIGCIGAIVGRALYEDRIDLVQALALATV